MRSRARADTSHKVLDAHKSFSKVVKAGNSLVFSSSETTCSFNRTMTRLLRIAAL